MVGTESKLDATSPALLLARRPGVFLLGLWACLSALYCLLIALQIHRRIWFDELLTYYIAKAPSLDRVRYLVKVWDLSPPLLHALAHASLIAARGDMIAIRLPSILAFYGASLLLYIYSARKLTAAFAALPVLILWYSPSFTYATEARPYGLLICFFCAVLLLYDCAISIRRRGWFLIGIAFCSAGMLLSHVLAPLSLLPFFFAELGRWKKRGKPDFLLWTALFAPLLLAVSYQPFVANYKTITYYPPAFQASTRKIFSFYWHVLSGVGPAVAAVVAAGLLATKGKWSLRPLLWPAYERTMYSVLLLVPLLLGLVMMYDRAPFWGRYCVTSVVAIYFLVALVVAHGLSRRVRAGHFAVAAASLALIAGRMIAPTVQNLLHPRPTNAAFLAKIRPDLPIVAASGMTFVEMGQYEAPSLSSRLFYLLDRSAAIRFAHATIFEDLGDFQKTFELRGHVEPYSEFTRRNRDFLVFGTADYPEDWLLRKLASDKAAVVRLGSYETPYKDKTVFEIHLRRESLASDRIEDPVTAHGISKS